MERAAALAAEGDWVGGYRIVRPLGARAEGRAYLAHDPVLDRPVVVRFVEAEGLGVARELARLGHPNLPRVHRISDAGPQPYVITEYIRGSRLSAAPSTGAPAARVFQAIWGAVEALHRGALAHGNLGLGAVVLDTYGEVRLLVGGHVRRLDAASRHADLAGLEAILGALAGRDGASAHARRAEREDDAARDRPAARSPYPGLLPYERADAASFFGRARTVVALIDRLRIAPQLVLAGRSGSGKSSVLHAGMQPAVIGGALGGQAQWDCVTLVPTYRPLHALADALASTMAVGREELCRDLRNDPELLFRFAANRFPRGLCLCVDQLETLFTVSDPAERDSFLAIVASFSTLCESARFVATIRSDALPVLAGLSGAARALLRATVLLPTMDRAELREAIVAPAAASGARFEDDALVDRILDEAGTSDAGLPILAFALSELWTARNPTTHTMTSEALTAMGGVAGALARHADRVIDALPPTDRRAARRLLLERVAVRRDPSALGAEASDAQRRARDALVHGRLVVVGEPHTEVNDHVRGTREDGAVRLELAHEALLRAWPRLRAWQEEASTDRAALARVVAAAMVWEKHGRHDDELLGAKQLAEVPETLDDVPALAREYLAESRNRVYRRRARGLALRFAVGALLAGAVVIAARGYDARQRMHVAQRARQARDAAADGDRSEKQAFELRQRAFDLFEREELLDAEALWKTMLRHEDSADAHRRRAEELLEAALALEPGGEARRLAHDVAAARAAAAERRHLVGLARNLRARLTLYEDGASTQPAVNANLTVSSNPIGATLRIARMTDHSGHRTADDPQPILGTLSVAPGSYLITSEMPGRWPTRYPVVLDPLETLSVQVYLPPEQSIPRGMVYIPRGRFRYGCGDDEQIRELMSHHPERTVDIPAFYIERHEVSWGDYLDYLATLAGDELRARLPSGLRRFDAHAVDVSIGGRSVSATTPYCLPGRPCVALRDLPVDGVGMTDGAAYASWRSARGTVPGARICTDREWERAARGADDRHYPWGDGVPAPDEACTFFTFGRDGSRAGFCAVGAHPLSRSPFDVEDMVGNVWEWTVGPRGGDGSVQSFIRGGSFWGDDLSIWLSNRVSRDAQSKYANYGIRICADAPDADRQSPGD